MYNILLCAHNTDFSFRIAINRAHGARMNANRFNRGRPREL